MMISLLLGTVDWLHLGDTVRLEAGVYTLSAPVEITQPTHLIGDGLVVIDGADATRLFEVHAPLQLTGVTLRRARVVSGQCGAAIRASADVALDHVIAEDNVVDGESDVDVGGAVCMREGILTVRHSYLTGNVAHHGAALYVGPSGSAVIERSTIYGNTYEALRSDGRVSVRRSTIGDTVVMASGVLAQSTLVHAELRGRAQLRRNVWGENVMLLGSFNDAGDNVRSKLAPLAFNGGAVPTHALLGPSGLDVFECEDDDARGERPHGLCDAGAFERQPAHLELTFEQQSAVLDVGGTHLYTYAVLNTGERRATGVRIVIEHTGRAPFALAPVRLDPGQKVTGHLVWHACEPGLYVARAHVEAYEAIEAVTRVLATAVRSHVSEEDSDAVETPLATVPSPSADARRGCSQQPSNGYLMLVAILANARARASARAQKK